MLDHSCIKSLLVRQGAHQQGKPLWALLASAQRPARPCAVPRCVGGGGCSFHIWAIHHSRLLAPGATACTADEFFLLQ